MKPEMRKRYLLGAAIFFVGWGGLLAAGEARAASLTLAPASGTFTVGNTFDVAVFLDTEGADINAVRSFLTFPPDKLQVVPRTAEQSIIAVYQSPPRFDNQAGIVDLQGGIPGGINVPNGQIIRFTFRVRAVGTAIVRVSSESRVLANDGLGTNVLSRTQNGVYDLILPPPAGPLVVSPTHPDQAKWYPNTTALLTWSAESAEVNGYSYIFNTLPTDVPDDISEGARTSVSYQSLGDGIKYFHIKSLRQGSWGGSTHFAISVDSTPPAEFPIEIVPGSRTTKRQPLIQYSTTDNLSGLEHYEIKIISLSPGAAGPTAGQPLFVEAVSPYLPQELALGSYDVVVRAYDKAGNFQEMTERLKIVPVLFRYLSGRGIEVRNIFVISWLWFWAIMILILLFLAYAAWRIKRWHDAVHARRAMQELPVNINERLAELRRYREKYGKLAAVILCLAAAGPIGFAGQAALAQSVALGPPYIETVARDISNEEIFYVGGKTSAGNLEVILYLQNLQSGETLSQTVSSDKNGDWFYRHDTFLSSGNYLLWAQSKLADQVSPPSPQIQMSVRPTAIQFGASRLSTEFLYLIFLIALLLVVAALVAYIVYHIYHGRRKHQLFLAEVKAAEESVRRGFAVLKRDIMSELAIVRQARLRGPLSEQEKQKELDILRDLEAVGQYVGQEFWELEKKAE